jgi:perosamine synthetase
LTLPELAQALPRRPCLSWRSWQGGPGRALPGPLNLPFQHLVGSGRAALGQALKILELPAGSEVLVPSYHCPTMIAPVLQAGLRPSFYGIDAQGLPLLDSLTPGAGAVIAAHWFGLARSMAALRAWCDQHQVALIEDCAHTLWGQAGERPVGHWGDLASASLTKFLPLQQAGLLAAPRPIPAPGLNRPSLRTQARGLKHLLSQRTPLPQPQAVQAQPDAATLYAACEMERTATAVLPLDGWLARHLPAAQSQQDRQRNYLAYASGLRGLKGLRSLFPEEVAPIAPYAFPLWVDDPDQLYQTLRCAGVPVFRWDRVWPGVPLIPGDQGPRWSRHVLQLLCHQSLREQDLRWIISRIRAEVKNDD